MSLICCLILSTHYEREDEIDDSGALTDLNRHSCFVDTFTSKYQVCVVLPHYILIWGLILYAMTKRSGRLLLRHTVTRKGNGLFVEFERKLQALTSLCAST